MSTRIKAGFGFPEAHVPGVYLVPHEFADQVADLVNAYIRCGTRDGIDLRWLSANDLDAPRAEPDDPCLREFLLKLPTKEGPRLCFMLRAEDGASYGDVRMPRAAELQEVATIEKHLATVFEAEDELRQHSRRTLLGDLGKVLADELHLAERESNRSCDRVRARASDPRRWFPIAKTASIAAVVWLEVEEASAA